MQSILERLEKREQDAINSRSKIAFHVITNKPKLHPLSSHNSKTLLDNYPMINLSIEDCELICKNKMVKRMMARALETPENELTELCKDINKFKKFVESKLKTIKERERAKKSPIRELPSELLSGLSAKTLRLFHLPEHIIEHITEESLVSLHKFKYKIVEYKLVDGITEDKLNQQVLSKNQNAIYYLVNSGRQIYYFWLSGNTSANAMGLLAEEMKINPDLDLDWAALSRNPEAFNILKANRDKIEWGILSQNTNPKAIKLIEKEIEKNPTHINWENIAANETAEAIALLKKHILDVTPKYDVNLKKIWQILSKNPKAIHILDANRDKIDWAHLSANESDEAIELIKEKMKKEDGLSPEKLAKLRDHEKINWSALSGNSNQKAFELLKNRPQNIDWGVLSGNTNPGAIILLMNKMNDENVLPENEYKALKSSFKINWKKISQNPNAIELIKKRIIYEDTLAVDRRRRLKYEESIDWNYISENPSIFTI